MCSSIDAPLESIFAGDGRPGLDADRFRAVVAYFGSGVTVISTRRAGEDIGSTASAFTSLSLEPPMVLACLYQGRKTEQAIAASGRFGVNILRDSQGEIADRFASKRSDRFAELQVRYGELGVPLLEGALAHFECRTVERVTGGTHTVFLGRVVSAEAHTGRPLAYYRGAFGQFVVGEDADIVEAIRREIVTGVLRPESELHPIETASRLATDPGAVLMAFRRLTADGHLVRRPDGVYTVTAPSRREIFDMISACRTIEVGVAETAVGWVETSRLDAWESTAAVACACFPGVAVHDEPDSLGFHEQMVGFAGNRRLLEHYRELSPASLSFRTAGSLGGLSDDSHVEDHLAMVAGFRAANLRQVTTAIDRHARRLRQIWAEAANLFA